MSPRALESVLCNKRPLQWKTHAPQLESSPAATRKSLHATTKIQHSWLLVLKLKHFKKIAMQEEVGSRNKQIYISRYRYTLYVIALWKTCRGSAATCYHLRCRWEGPPFKGPCSGPSLDVFLHRSPSNQRNMPSCSWLHPFGPHSG